MVITEVAVAGISKINGTRRLEDRQEWAVANTAAPEMSLLNMLHPSSHFLLSRFQIIAHPSTMLRRNKKKMPKTCSARRKNSVLRTRKKAKRKTKSRCLRQVDLHQQDLKVSKIHQSSALLSKDLQKPHPRHQNPRSPRSSMLALCGIFKPAQTDLVVPIREVYQLSQLQPGDKTSVPNLRLQRLER